jgi:predicted murein hydrolase (TIGR00659 family)
MKEVLIALFWFAITIVIFLLAVTMYRRTKSMLLNPVLWTVALLIVLLQVLKTEYKTYMQGGEVIAFFLGPSVVALGVLMYDKYELLKKHALAIAASITIGGIAGMVSVAVLAILLRSSHAIVMTLVPKSVTTPIAIKISATLGGLESLTAAVVIAVGIFGAMLGPWMFDRFGFHHPIARGLALGTAAHGMGTAQANEEGTLQGAAAALGMCLNGLLTAFLAPAFVSWIY